jgi:hypothetical protein
MLVYLNKYLLNFEYYKTSIKQFITLRCFSFFKDKSLKFGANYRQAPSSPSTLTNINPDKLFGKINLDLVHLYH